MGNNGIKIAALSTIGITSFFALGWSFFEITVRCNKKKASSRKSFQFRHMKLNHPRNGFEKEYEEGKAWCQRKKMQDCYIQSADGLSLHAFYLPAKNAKRIVLLSHGYKGTGFGDFAYMAKFLHEHGCSLLFIEQRCCGESEGEYITFGAREKYDVQRWAYYISKRNKKKLPIYFYGESMGAAAILMASGLRLPEEVKGIIADCGFQSMRGQLQIMASDWFHLKWIGLLLFREEVFCRFFGKFRMKEADTTEALKINRRPVLFFHGSEDTYVNPKNSEYNYKLCRSPKELVIVPGARHLCSVYAAPELYRGKVLEFFEKYDE